MSGPPADVLPLLAEFDGLYQAVASDPGSWDDSAFASWVDDVQHAHPQVADRAVAREVRRLLRQAAKLARYWTVPGVAAPPNWRSAVDGALGGPGWAPSLAIAQLGLERRPDPELFDEVKARFRVVKFQPWLEGVDYAAWLASRPESADDGRPPSAGNEAGR